MPQYYNEYKQRKIAAGLSIPATHEHGRQRRLFERDLNSNKQRTQKTNEKPADLDTLLDWAAKIPQSSSDDLKHLFVTTKISANILLHRAFQTEHLQAAMNIIELFTDSVFTNRQQKRKLQDFIKSNCDKDSNFSSFIETVSALQQALPSARHRQHFSGLLNCIGNGIITPNEASALCRINGQTLLLKAASRHHEAAITTILERNPYTKRELERFLHTEERGQYVLRSSARALIRTVHKAISKQPKHSDENVTATAATHNGKSNRFMFFGTSTCSEAAPAPETYPKPTAPDFPAAMAEQEPCVAAPAPETYPKPTAPDLDTDPPVDACMKFSR